MATTSVAAYPLQWPKGVPRSKQARQAAFKSVHWDRTINELHHELKLLGGSYVTISTNMKLRNDGKPYAQQGPMTDAGVAVYFTLDGQQICFPCDRWATMAHNLKAIVKHIEAMRGQQRWGVGTAKQAFAGYKALTATAGEYEDWWFVLGVLSTATEEQVREAHRALVRKAHPDAGGSADQMARINTARDRALAEIRSR